MPTALLRVFGAPERGARGVSEPMPWPRVPCLLLPAEPLRSLGRARLRLRRGALWFHRPWPASCCASPEYGLRRKAIVVVPIWGSRITYTFIYLCTTSIYTYVCVYVYDVCDMHGCLRCMCVYVCTRTCTHIMLFTDTHIQLCHCIETSTWTDKGAYIRVCQRACSDRQISINILTHTHTHSFCACISVHV